MAEIIDKLLNCRSVVSVNYHGCQKRPIVVSVIQLDLALVDFVLRVLENSCCTFVGLFDNLLGVTFQGFENLAFGRWQNHFWLCEF